MVSVGLNCLVLEGDSVGVASYTLGLVEGLWSQDRDNRYILFGSVDRLGRMTRRGITIDEPPVRARSRLWRLLWEHFALARRASRLGVDVLHLPDHTYPVLPASCPSVLTVHDLGFVVHPETFDLGRRIYKSALVRRSVRMAARIVADSNSTRRDLITRLGVSPSKITVVPLASHRRFFQRASRVELQRVRARYALPERFVLYVGTLEPRKNLAMLLRAWARLREIAPSTPPLVIVGRRGWKVASLFRQIDALGVVGSVILPGFVPADDLPAIYQAAELFVYPSIYEGFGLPVVEAMASGVPVITSNRSALPEVAGDAAVLVDPFSPDELAGRMAEFLDDASLRAEYSERGRIRARQFSWERTARETARVYREAAESGARGRA